MILKAAWVLPVARPPIRNGLVHVRRDQIVAIDSGESVRTGGAAVTDLGQAVLMPGLVNPHTHLELTCYADQLQPGPFWDWLPKLVKLRRAPGQVERERQGVHDGAWQSLRAGVTCVGDISRLNLHWPVLKSIPLRKVCYVELLALADDPPRDPAELRAALERVEEDPLLTAGVTPHTPYTVPARQVRAAILLAAEFGRPWCTHWAETAEERAFLRGEERSFAPHILELLAQCDVSSPRSSAIELLERCCAGAPPGALAHFNYAEPGDAERLAAAGHVVVYCPRAHRFFGHPPHPYREFMRAGVTVALGTDSAAGNENLSLLEELRYLLVHTPDPPAPSVLLEMATRNAARALGLHERIGTLEVGKQADLAAFPLAQGVTDPARALIEQAPPAGAAWVAGRRVV